MKHTFSTVLIGSALGICAAGSGAMTIKVTTTADSADGSCDSSHCSLREAVTLANSSAGADVIRLPAGSYNLSIKPEYTEYGDDPYDPFYSIEDENSNANGDLDISSDITIYSPDADAPATVNGGSIDRVLDVRSGTVTLKNIIVRGGQNYSVGAGIRNKGSLTLRNVQVIKNTTDAEDDSLEGTGMGAGIYNTGKLVLYSSSVSYNTLNTTLNNAYGAGVYSSGTLLIRNSELNGNRAGAYSVAMGGAVYNSGTADIRKSYFYANTLGADDATLGAAVANSEGGKLRLETSTATKNKAATYYSQSSGEVQTRTAVISNGSRNNGNDGSSLRLANVTVVANQGIGLSVSASATVTNSILLKNKDDDYWDNCSVKSGASLNMKGTIVGAVYDGSCSTELSYSDTRLSALLTSHYQPLYYVPVSSGIATDGAVSACPSRDMLNQLMGNDGNSDGVENCDIGALEYQP